MCSIGCNTRAGPSSSRRPGWASSGSCFEGRPNVFADACGVLRSGNTVVFRIGSDAAGYGSGHRRPRVDPAIRSAGLPRGAATLVDSASRGDGLGDVRRHALGLAVARGSGTAVAQLGSVARQAGVPVSLHGTAARGSWPERRRMRRAHPGGAAFARSQGVQTPSTRAASSPIALMSWCPRSSLRCSRRPMPGERTRNCTSPPAANSHVPESWRRVVRHQPGRGRRRRAAVRAHRRRVARRRVGVGGLARGQAW